MHQIIFILLLSFTLPLMAQTDQPGDLQPIPELPEPPPLPPEIEFDPELEPEITIIKRAEATIEEHRINGELYMIKVIPVIGLPYYLVQNRGRGQFTHSGEPGSNVSPPMWRILEF
tara:strand:- start:1582 stop:1929 length:348 start_codon:yes stop_codon:yes gene_type:complete